MSVSNQRRTQLRRLAGHPLLAACAALVVVLAAVAPAFAGDGPTKLSQPNVSPRAGTPATTISFTVWYKNREGSAPDRVSAVIDGVEHAMTSSGSTDWRGGVEFTWSTKLPAGTYAIDFTAIDTRDKFSDHVGAGSVTIAAPTPTPTPTPIPTPDPTPKPTPTPAPGGGDPTPAPTPTGAPADGTGGTSGGGTTTTPGGTGADGSGGTDSPAAGGTGGTGGTGSTGGSDDRGGILFPGSTGPDGTGGTGSTGSTGGDSTPGSTGSGGSGGAGGAGAVGHPGWTGWTPGDDPTTAPGSTPRGTTSTDVPAGTGASGGEGRSSGNGGPGWGALATALQTLGLERPSGLTVIPMLVGTTGAMSMAFAFAIFGKKRRDEAPPAPDEVLQANAARGINAVPGGDVVRSVAVPALVDPEAGMPRWRRPSVQAARKADPSRYVATSAPMTFESGIAAAVDGRERRVIRYAVVRLLDAPDELRSTMIGQLDQGDEVQLIERSGAYWLVLCPNGQQGWIHKMTLGEIVSDAAPSLARDIDDDVLTAFLAARARA